MDGKVMSYGKALKKEEAKQLIQKARGLRPNLHRKNQTAKVQGSLDTWLFLACKKDFQLYVPITSSNKCIPWPPAVSMPALHRLQ